MNKISTRRMLGFIVAFFTMMMPVWAQDLDVFSYEICEGLTIQPSSLYRVYDGYEIVSVLDKSNNDIKAEPRITPPAGINTYTVNYRNTRTGEALSRQTTVTVVGKPVFTVTATPSDILSGAAVCPGTEVKFQVTAKNAPVSWTVAGSSVSEQTDAFTHKVTENCRIYAQSYNQACGTVEQSYAITLAEKPDVSKVRPVLDTVIRGSYCVGCGWRPDVLQVLKGAVGGAEIDYANSSLQWADAPGTDVEKGVLSGINRHEIALHVALKVNGDKCADVSSSITYDTNFYLRLDKGVLCMPTVISDPVLLKPCEVAKVRLASTSGGTLQSPSLTSDDPDLAGTGAPKETVPDPSRDIRSWDLTWGNYTGKTASPVLQVQADYTQNCPLSKLQPVRTMPFRQEVSTRIDTSYLSFTYDYCPDGIASLEVIGDSKKVKDISAEFVSPAGVGGRLRKIDPPAVNSLLSYKTTAAVSESEVANYSPLTIKFTYRVETGTCAFSVNETRVVVLNQKNCNMAFTVNPEGCIGNENEQYYTLTNKPENFVPDSVVFDPNPTFTLVPGSWNADNTRFSFRAYYAGAAEKDSEVGSVSATLYYHNGAGAPAVSTTTEGTLKVKTCPPELSSVTKLTPPICPGTRMFAEITFTNSSLDTARSKVEFIADAGYIKKSNWNLGEGLKYTISNYPIESINYRVAVTYNQGDSIYRIDSLPLVKDKNSIPPFIEVGSSCDLIKTNDGAKCCKNDAVEVAIQSGNTNEALQRIEWMLAPGQVAPVLEKEAADPKITGGKILYYKITADQPGVYPFRAYSQLINKTLQGVDILGEFSHEDTVRLEVNDEPHIFIQDTVYACKGSALDMSDYIDWNTVSSVITPSSLLYQANRDDDWFEVRAQMAYSCVSGTNPLTEQVRIIAEDPVYLDPKTDTSVCPNTPIRFSVATNGRVSWFRRTILADGGYSAPDTLCFNVPFYEPEAKPIDTVKKESVLYTVRSQSVCPGSDMQMGFMASPYQLPTLQIVDNSACASLPIRLQLDYDKTQVDTADVSWLVNGQRPASDLVQVPVGGSVAVSCSVRDKTTGCTNQDEIRLYAYPVPAVRIEPKTTGNTLCVRENASQIFTATGAEAYEWRQKGSSTLGQSDRFTWQGDEETVLYVTGMEKTHNCASTDSVAITFYAVHPQRDDTIACMGAELDYTVEQEEGVAYQWYLPDGKPLDCTCAVISFAPYEPADTGVYILQYTRGECVDSMQVGFSMYRVPQMDFVQGGSFCEGEKLELNLLTDMSAEELAQSKFIWYDGYTGNELQSGFGLTDYEGNILSVADAGMFVVSVEKDVCFYDAVLEIWVDAHSQPSFSIEDFYCEGDRLELEAEDQGEGALYRWYLGSGTLEQSNSPVAVVAALQMADNAPIMLEITRGACVDSLTLQLDVRSRPVPDVYMTGGWAEENGTGMYFCEGMPITLQSRGLLASDTMAWYFNGVMLPGSESGSYRIESAALENTGRYDFVVKRNGCNGDNSLYVNVRVMPQITLADTFLCSGVPLVLDASDLRYPGASFHWDVLNINSAVAFITEGGDYSLSIEYNGCQMSKTISVEERPSPSIGFPSDTAMCQRDSVLLEGPEGMENYRWQDGSDNAFYVVKEAGAYSLFVENNGCTDFSEVYVKEEFCSNLYFPTAFTPDGDGINDEFGPLTTAEDNQLTYWLRIFNTNGEEVFSGKKLQEKWDGTFKGKPCPPGIYLYRCNAKVLDGGRDLSTTGRITLIR